MEHPFFSCGIDRAYDISLERLLEPSLCTYDVENYIRARASVLVFRENLPKPGGDRGSTPAAGPYKLAIRGAVITWVLHTYCGQPKMQKR